MSDTTNRLTKRVLLSATPTTLLTITWFLCVLSVSAFSLHSELGRNHHQSSVSSPPRSFLITTTTTTSNKHATSTSTSMMTQTQRRRRTNDSHTKFQTNSNQRRSLFQLYGTSNNDDDEEQPPGWQVSLTGIPSFTTNNNNDNNNNGTTESSSPAVTSLIDYILSLLTSDIGSILLGLTGLTVTLVNRLSSIDYTPIIVMRDNADAMGMQSRSDLLAVFASGAVLLNGISKLDVTSVVAERVVLEGVRLDDPRIFWREDDSDCSGGGDGNNGGELLAWALESVIDATPADSVVVLRHDGGPTSSWVPVAMGGILPPSAISSSDDDDDDGVLGKPMVEVSTPILNRFLQATAAGGNRNTKESYLPTLQALPGKVEFLTYLPQNAQEVLLVPIPLEEDVVEDRRRRRQGGGGGREETVVLVLGGATSKSFSPKDVAWCQVLAGRMGKDFPIGV